MFNNSMLEQLYSEVLECRRCPLAEIRIQNSLLPVRGAGCSDNPFLMLVAINPTPKNPTIHLRHEGKKKGLPFAGDKPFWKFLVEVKLLDESILDELKHVPPWSDDVLNLLEERLKKRRIFLTEIVKCPTLHGELPPRKAVKRCIPFLEREIEFLRPKFILAFGALVFKAITGKNVVLKRFVSPEGLNTSFIVELPNGSRVIPCYFPTGRGNKRKAVECVRLVSERVFG